jgi:hypothetical protein
MNDADNLTATCFGHFAAFQSYREETGDTQWQEEEAFGQLWLQDFNRLTAADPSSDLPRRVASQSRDETLEVLRGFASGSDRNAAASFLAARQQQCLLSIGLWPKD